MSELARRRLARASRNWFCDTELATTAESYVRHLSQQGYASGTIDAYLGSVAHFAHWCTRLHIGLSVVNEGTVERFLSTPLPLRTPLPTMALQRLRSPSNFTLSLAHRRSDRTEEAVRSCLDHRGDQSLRTLLETGVWPTPHNVQRSDTARSRFPSPAICRWSYTDRCRQTC
jgi:hypothetical protein